MTKKLLSMTSILLFSGLLALQAQDMTYGFKAGVNFSTINSLDFNSSGTDAADAIADGIEDGHIAYYVGFTAGIPLSDHLTFQPEFMYSQQGVDREEFRVDYLHLPLGLRFDVSKLFFNIGPQLSIKVWAPDESNVFSNFEASAFGGIGVMLTKGFYLEGRYLLGITDIFQDGASVDFSQNTSFSNLEGRNAVVQIGLGYRL